MKVFWKRVDVTEGGEGCEITLDGRPVRTPGRAPLLLPNRALADVVAGQAHQLPLDDTGRIVMPEAFRELAGITDSAYFVGRINTFQIWNPEKYEAVKAQRRETAVANFDKLPWGGGTSH